MAIIIDPQGVVKDHVRILRCVSEHGVVKELSKLYRIEVAPPGYSDYKALGGALHTAGIPEEGSGLDDPNCEALILARREVELVDQDPGHMDVICHYMHVMDGCQEIYGGKYVGQYAMAGFASLLFGTSKSSIVQRSTNLMYAWSDPRAVPDNNGVVTIPCITVQHTYPGVGTPGDAGSYWPGQTLTQGGEIDVPVVMDTFTLQGFVETDNIALCKRQFRGKVNVKTWKGEKPRTWLCTSFDDVIAASGRYHVTIEFQNDPDTWDPWVVFIDQVTGRPPPNLVAGTGYKQIPFLPSADFEALLKAKVEGDK